VRHAHAIFNCSILSADLSQLRRDLKIEKSKFRIRNKGEKLNIVNAMMEDDDGIVEIEDKILELEAKVGVLSAIAAGYESLRNAASREISRRLSERAAVD
jgi:hypothetical protein